MPQDRLYTVALGECCLCARGGGGFGGACEAACGGEGSGYVGIDGFISDLDV